MNPKPLRHNLSRFARRSLGLLLAATLAVKGASFTTSGRQVLHDGAAFQVRGVAYQPTPIGDNPSVAPPYGDYYTAAYGALAARDLPLLRQLGADVIRVYGWDPAADHTAFLDACFNGGVDPVYVLVNRWIDPATDWSDSAAVDAIRQEYLAMDAGLNNHPAVLGIVLGNEVDAQNGNGANAAFWSAMNSIAASIKQQDPGRLVSLALDDALQDVAAHDGAMTALDFWCVQVYRGTTFGSLFTDFAAASGRPLVITEFGIDAFNQLTGLPYPDNAAFVGTTVAGLWNEIESNKAVCAGGCVFEFSDEWWKDSGGSPTAHDTGGDVLPGLPDGFANEEWWGLYAVAANGTAPDTLTPRATVAALRALWTQAPFFTRQPAAQTVAAGGTARFSTAAGGMPAPTLEWQVSTDDGGSWADVPDGSPCSGATTGALTIAGVTVAMNGRQYRCVADNGVSPDAVSSAVTLRVISAGAFLQNLFPLVLGRPVDSGALAAFSAAISGGMTPAQVYADLIASPEFQAWQVEPVIRLYLAAFNRIPDYAGLQNWSAALHAGSLSLTDAANGFATSAEFLQTYGTLDNTGFVEQLYLNVLGREADTGGLNDWVGLLNGGASRGAVLIGFSESDEFKADSAAGVEVIRLYYLLEKRAPTAPELQTWLDFLKGYDQTDALYALAYPSGIDNAAYIEAVFSGFLRRDADAGALNSFGAAMAAGAVTPASLVDAIMSSDEFQQDVAPVARLYLSALLRVPDPPGLDAWVNYIRAGNTLQSMADLFASSAEFMNRYGAMDNTAYVTALYQNILGRQPDTDGRADWVGQLDKGTATRSQVLIGFAQSQEAVALFAPTMRTFLHCFAFFNTAPTQAQLDYWTTYLTTLTDQMRESFIDAMGPANGA